MCGNATFTTVVSIVTIPDPRTVVDRTQRPAAIPILSPLGSAARPPVVLASSPSSTDRIICSCSTGSAAYLQACQFGRAVEAPPAPHPRRGDCGADGRAAAKDGCGVLAGRDGTGATTQGESNCRNHLFGGTQPCAPLRCTLRRHHQGQCGPPEGSALSATVRAAVSLVTLIGFLRPDLRAHRRHHRRRLPARQAPRHNALGDRGGGGRRDRCYRHAVVGGVCLRPPRPLPGLDITPQDAPELWALVAGISAAAGTAGPAPIHLVSDVNASVSEDSRLWADRRPRQSVAAFPSCRG